MAELGSLGVIGFMSDLDFKVKREVQELRAEVRRLRRTLEGGFVVIGLAVIVVFPQLLLFAVAVAVITFLAFLVSPVRHLIFDHIFHRLDDHEPDA